MKAYKIQAADISNRDKKFNNQQLWYALVNN